MIVMQIMKVLPAGSHFKILDENRPVLEGSLAMVDKSVMFKHVNDDLKYQKVFGFCRPVYGRHFHAASIIFW